MNLKAIVAVALGGFILLSLFVLFYHRAEAPPVGGVIATGGRAETVAAAGAGGAEGAAITEGAREGGEKVVVYYFHGHFRCATCQKIEELSAETIKDVFADELSAGRLEWRLVNTDEPGNEHFKEEFNLHGNSLVMAAMSEGERLSWKVCEKVWELVLNEDKLRQYVEHEARAYLEAS